MHRPAWLLALWFLLPATGGLEGAEPDVPAVRSDVSAERLTAAAEEPGNWLMYSGQYSGQRFSRLDSINDKTVGNLRLKWVRQFPTLTLVETTPLVVDGVMYASIPPNEVVALNAETGLQFWSYKDPTADDLCICCGKVNRGVAISGETLFRGTLDAHLVAIDCRSGNPRWRVRVADYTTGHSITAAPLVVKDMVITGIAGGEYGIRGSIAAYDVKTGVIRWRTYSIPGPGEPGHESWAGASWKTGGAATWMTGTYDPQLNLIYWGVGNPGPDYNGEVREGDNLYSDSVLAIDADTGKIKWHFQFTPHDVWDWDACQVPVLVDTVYQGAPRKLMLFANRNGFFYVLDRTSGEFLLGKAFAKQTWADGLDARGRPRVRADKLPSKEGTLVYPDATGAANWWPPAYSPRTGLYYVMAYDGGAKFYIGEAIYKAGRPYLGGIPDRDGFYNTYPDPSFASAVRALDPQTGALVWEHRVPPKSTSGLLNTAGNLLFAGTARGNFLALNAQNGKQLWRLDLGARVHSAPLTYRVKGQQYVTVAAGNALFTFGL